MRIFRFFLIVAIPAIIAISVYLSWFGRDVDIRPDIRPNLTNIRPTTGIGTIPGRLSVSRTGAANYHIPIRLPAGPNGHAPRLALNYNSASGIQHLGVGWTLSGFSRIARCKKNLFQDGVRDDITFSSGDVYCFNRQRLIPRANPGEEAYRLYSVQNNSNLLIRAYGDIADPDYFEALLPDGTVLKFAARASARRVLSPEMDGTLIRDEDPVAIAWGVSEQVDKSGNIIAIEWEGAPDSAALEFRPVRLRYAFDRVSEGDVAIHAREVLIRYEVRPDKVESFVNGFPTLISKRISGIEIREVYPNGSVSLGYEYRLTYDDFSITKRSLLTEVALCDARGTCLPPTKFEWSAGNFEFEVIADPYEPSIEFKPVLEEVVIADFNGDGRDDIIAKREGNNYRVRMSNGRHFDPPVDVSLSHLFTSRNRSPIEGILDIDNDGKDEIAWFDGHATMIGSWSTSTEAFTPKQYIACNVPGSPTEFSFAFRAPRLPRPAEQYGYAGDLTGDGVSDLLRRCDGGEYWSIWKGAKVGVQPFIEEERTGVSTPQYPSDRWTSRTQITQIDGNGIGDLTFPSGDRVGWFSVSQDGRVSAQQTNIRSSFFNFFIDVNGDGLSDVLNARPDPGGAKLRINTGRGFGPGREVLGPGAADPYTGAPQRVPADLVFLQPLGILAADFNNDGRTDFYQIDHGEIFVSRGTHYEAVASNDFGIRRRPAGPYESDDAYLPIKAMDIDGNGVQDMLVYDQGHLKIYRRTGERPDLLKSVEDGLGAQHDIEYQTTVEKGVYSDRAVTCAYPRRCAAEGMLVVSKLLKDNGVDKNVTSFQYFDGRYDLRGADFVGFHRVRQHDEAVQRWIERQYINDPDEEGYYSLAHIPAKVTTAQIIGPKQMLLNAQRQTFRRIKSRFNDSYLLRVASNTVQEYWLTSDIPRPSVIPPIATGLASISAGAELVRTVETQQRFDDLGNVLSRDWGIDGGNQMQSVFEYAQSTAPWITGLLKSVQTDTQKTPADRVIRFMSFQHDERGRVKRSCLESSGGAKKCTAMERDIYGNIVLKRRLSLTGDDADREWQVTWGRFGIYAKASRNTIGHRASAEYQPLFGRPTRLEDANGLVTELFYDGLGRLVERKEPNALEVSYQIEASDEFAFRTNWRVNTGRSGYFEYDRMGRARKSGGNIDDSRSEAFMDYDKRGFVSRLSQPVFEGELPQFTTYERDNLGRSIKTSYADGTVSRRQYSPLETRYWDPDGNMSLVRYDVNGDIIEAANRVEGGRWLSTRYQFTPVHDLKSVTDPAGNEILSLAYDDWGRLTMRTDLDSGDIIFAYSEFDELETVTYADGQKVVYSHDDLGRVTQISTGRDVMSYQWDGASADGERTILGRMASMTSADGVTTNYHYDSLSQLVAREVQLDGENYRTEMTLDRYGRTVSIGYPAATGRNVASLYEYADNGWLSQIRLSDNGEETLLWSSQQRDAAGRLQQSRYGNGLIVSNEYDDASGRVKRLSTYQPDTTTAERRYMQDLKYAYHPMGHLKSRTDRVLGREETFDYDRLYRLTTWKVGGVDDAGGYRYAYDDIGNLTTSDSIDGRKNYRYSLSRPHLLDEMNGATYKYDSRGRRVRGGGLEIDYTWFNLPSRIRGDSQDNRYVYDAAYRQVLRTERDTRRISPDSLYTRFNRRDRSDTEEVVSVPGPMGTLAEIRYRGSDREVTYIHTDALASPYLVTDQSGTAVQRVSFSPFGQSIGGPAGTVSDFTGHRRDEAIGLIDMKGRYFDPHTRNFLTGDPAHSSLLFSQDLNRYSYALNSPLTFTDPTGFQEAYPGSDSCSQCDFEEGSLVNVDQSQGMSSGPPVYDDGYTSDMYDGFGNMSGYQSDGYNEPDQSGVAGQDDYGPGAPAMTSPDFPWSYPHYDQFGGLAPSSIDYHTQHGNLIAIGVSGGVASHFAAGSGGAGIYLDLDSGEIGTFTGGFVGVGTPRQPIGVSGSLIGYYSPGGVPAFSGPSVAAEATGGPVVGGASTPIPDNLRVDPSNMGQNTYWLGGTVGTDPTPTGTVGLGYTSTQPMVPIPSNVRERAMSQGFWMAYDDDNHVIGNQVQVVPYAPSLSDSRIGQAHFSINSLSNDGEPNACVFPARPDLVNHTPTWAE